MKNCKHPQAVLAAAVTSSMLALSPAVRSQAPSTPADSARKVTVGTIVGVVTNAAKAPVAYATVTAVLADGASVRGTVSNSEGVYSFADLPPGRWTVTSEADGYPETSAQSISVVSSKVTRYDIVMQPPGLAGPGARVASTGAAPSTSQAPVAQLIAPVGQSGAQSQVASAPQNQPPRVAESEGFFATLKHAVALVAEPAPPRIRQAQAQPALTQAQVAETAKAAAKEVVTTVVPEALQAPDPAPANDTYTPLANVGDIGWMNGNTRESSPIFDTKFFTPEVRFDVNYIQSTNQPRDHTIVGSTEEFRSGEFQIEQVSFGGNFHWNGVQARFLSMMGQFSTATTRNDASAGVGQWDLQGAYKYFSEANAGYHWDNIGHGFSVDAGIFVSYIGLFSYYNFDNWTYQPSYVSSNTPWFFNGLRIQYWPTQNLKIEPWLINGWQSNAKYNKYPGFGGQILYIPSNNVKWVFNSYFLGQDNQTTITPGAGNGTVNPYCPGVSANPACSPVNGVLPVNGTAINWRTVHRMHEDDSFLYKFYDHKEQTGISKMAMSLTWDFGCEYGGGVDCLHGPNKANFLGIMEYSRFWLDHNIYAVTVGGGWMTNPGRYLTLLPPINGATAATGSPYFTEIPGQKITQWDAQLNFQYMPKDWITWWTEVTFRHSNIPYWTGSGGVTPPNAGTGTFSNNGNPTSLTCANGTTAGADNCQGGEGGYWFPDLRKDEWVWGLGVMVKF
jgi:hypothetical protein